MREVLKKAADFTQFLLRISRKKYRNKIFKKRENTYIKFQKPAILLMHQNS